MKLQNNINIKINQSANSNTKKEAIKNDAIERTKRLDKAKMLKNRIIKQNINNKQNEVHSEDKIKKVKPNEEDVNEKNKRLEKAKLLKNQFRTKHKHNEIVKDIMTKMNKIEITPGIKEKLDISYAYANKTFEDEWSKDMEDFKPPVNKNKVDNNVTNGEKSEVNNIDQHITKTKSMKRKLENDDESEQSNKLIKINPNIAHENQSNSNYNFKKKQINPAIKHSQSEFNKTAQKSTNTNISVSLKPKLMKQSMMKNFLKQKSLNNLKILPEKAVQNSESNSKSL